MWLAKPWYESLPYVYGLAGCVAVAVSWFATTGAWPAAWLLVGAALLLYSLVLWLRRKDFRSQRRQYDSHSLDQASGTGVI
jgi:membrane protein YdbS with pleckstrin-like domain